MSFLERLPGTLEDPKALIERRNKAAQRKELWRSLYSECYRFAMPARETFNWQTPGTFRNHTLFDSTLQEATYTAANTMVALLFPGWKRWMELATGGAIPKDKVTKQIVEGLQEATKVFFDFLNHSNFSTVISEVALDLMVGTGALRFDEGPTDDNPFVFSATPLSAIELEEGPNGTIETVHMARKPLARNLTRMYSGMEEFDLPQQLQEKIQQKPDEEIDIIQSCIFYPETGHYYGVVLWKSGDKDGSIIWRYDYGQSSPEIVARASKISGEIYGRGRVMLALSDARTLDKMQEFVLRHSAQQIAPPMTGVSDGVLNPFTAVLAPNTILPVASNDSKNPSLRPIDIGGNFRISQEIMTSLRERVRRILLGPEPSEGPVKSATEINIADRNRLWAMGGEYGRIQVELLAKIVHRGIYILQRRGIIPQFRVDGREVTTVFTSPFARSQDAEDLLALERTMGLLAPIEGSLQVGIKVEELPAWISAKAGLDQKLVRDEDEREAEQKKAADAVVQLAGQAQEAGVPLK